MREYIFFSVKFPRLLFPPASGKHSSSAVKVIYIKFFAFASEHGRGNMDEDLCTATVRNIF
jgi:hypothetical protein